MIKVMMGLLIFRLYKDSPSTVQICIDFQIDIDIQIMNGNYKLHGRKYWPMLKYRASFLLWDCMLYSNDIASVQQSMKWPTLQR